MTMLNKLKHASLALIVTALAIPLHVSASERDGLATQFQATAEEAAASFREQLKVNLATTIQPPMRFDAGLVVVSKQVEDGQTSLDQSNEAG